MRLWRNLFLRLTTPADFAKVALATTAEKACTLTLAQTDHQYFILKKSGV